MQRFSLSDPKMKTSQSDSKGVSAILFGKDQILNQTSSQRTPNPLAIFCMRHTENDIFGDTIEGFSNLVFCNMTKHVQTDVGICIANDPAQYWYEGKVFGQAIDSEIKEDLRNAEHVMILSTDKFEESSGFLVWLIKFLLFFHVFLNKICFFRL